MSFSILHSCWNFVSSIFKWNEEVFTHPQIEMRNEVLTNIESLVWVPEAAKQSIRRPVGGFSKTPEKIPGPFEIYNRSVCDVDHSTPLRSAYNLRNRQCICDFNRHIPKYNYRRVKATRKKPDKKKKKRRKAKTGRRCNKYKACIRVVEKNKRYDIYFY